MTALEQTFAGITRVMAEHDGGRPDQDPQLSDLLHAIGSGALDMGWLEVPGLGHQAEDPLAALEAAALLMLASPYGSLDTAVLLDPADQLLRQIETALGPSMDQGNTMMADLFAAVQVPRISQSGYNGELGVGVNLMDQMAAAIAGATPSGMPDNLFSDLQNALLFGDPYGAVSNNSFQELPNGFDPHVRFNPTRGYDQLELSAPDYPEPRYLAIGQ